MRCPTCDVALIDNDRLGVRTGYCPECLGEWFTAGAADRLLDRAAASVTAADGGGRGGAGRGDGRVSRGEVPEPTAAGGGTADGRRHWL